MRLAALFSGGKDSTFAIMKAIEAGHSIACLITISPKRSDSYMFHYPCLELTKLQAKSMGTPQIWRQSSGRKEEELADLKDVLKSVAKDVDGVVSGAVSSSYQKTRIDAICKDLNLVSYAPLWGMKPFDVLRQEVAAGVDAVIAAVATDALTEGWIGRTIDGQAIADLEKLRERKEFNPQFEGGEAESFVVDCPLFRQRIVIDRYEKVWEYRTSSGYMDVKKVYVIEK